MRDPNRPLTAGKIAALTVLKHAYDDAEDAGREPREFAVVKAELVKAGAIESDLRWLVAEHLAEAFEDITPRGAAKRQLRGPTQLSLPERACLVLSYAGSVYAQHNALNGRVHRDKRRALPSDDKRRRGSSGSTGKPNWRPGQARNSTSVATANEVVGSRATSVPQWHPLEGELYFRRELVRRRSRKVAKLEERVLTAFQDESWARYIANPFRENGADAVQQLAEAVRRLNNSLLVDTLKFHVPADGSVVWWEDRVAGNKLRRHKRINRE